MSTEQITTVVHASPITALEIATISEISVTFNGRTCSVSALFGGFVSEASLTVIAFECTTTSASSGLYRESRDCNRRKPSFRRRERKIRLHFNSVFSSASNDFCLTAPNWLWCQTRLIKAPDRSNYYCHGAR